MTDELSGIKARRKRRNRTQYTTATTMESLHKNQQLDITQNLLKDPSCFSKQINVSNGNDSEEDDMYLFDVPMHQFPALDPNHEFAKIIDELIVSTLERFLPTILLGDSPNQRERSWPKAKKRVGTYHTRNMNLGQMMGEKNRHAILDKHPMSMKQYFPCPFYMSNPEKHINCLIRANLRDIKDVKQHLWNTHQLPPYCPTCREIFSTTRSCNNHIRGQSCSPRTIPRPDGITTEQMQQLARRAEIWVPRELQWLSLWTIVFPSADILAVEYPSCVVELVICRFRDYWSRYGEKIISDFLKEKDLCNYELRDEERSLAALHATVLRQVIDRLVGIFKYEDRNSMSAKVEQVLASLRHL
ncbi:hypothetical protein F4819DRAFT_476882 [Hypoxylon fuscum]|nr:hypothetical protein F4819DRAFT_476882 [Hypoxylon fuscum]